MLLAGLLLVLSSVGQVLSHGRLMEPPSRVSAWRLGLATPTHYNDHQTNCGGVREGEAACQPVYQSVPRRQWRRNRGRCGVCGDAADLPQPRDGEGGGRCVVAVYRL